MRKNGSNKSHPYLFPSPQTIAVLEKKATVKCRCFFVWIRGQSLLHFQGLSSLSDNQRGLSF